MRALSERQAGRCEHAQTARCQCRCGGAFHGAARGQVTDLPATDVHRPAVPRPSNVRRAERLARAEAEFWAEVGRVERSVQDTLPL
jgi:hypothetical protein